MLKSLKHLTGNHQKTSAATLKEKSNDILSSFINTKKELQELKAEQSDYIATLEADKLRINAEIDAVASDSKSTNKIITKIDEFLS